MKSATRHISALAFAAALLGAGVAQASIDGRVSFHPPYMITSGGPQNEGGAHDNGGIILGVFQNNTGSVLNTSGLTAHVNGTEASDYSDIPWYRIWPREVAPGGTFSLEIKSMGSPVQAGLNANLEIRQGATTLWQQSYTPSALPIRIGHVVPSRDRNSVTVFVRNMNASTPYVLDRIVWNGVDKSVATSVIDGTTLPASGMMILQLPAAVPQADLTPVHLELEFDDAGTTRLVQAVLRITEPEFHLGTWSGSIFQQTETVRSARSMLGHSVAVSSYNRRSIHHHGTGHAMRSIVNERVDDSLDPADVIEGRENAGMYGWALYDEPEIRGVSAARAARWNVVYWDHSPVQPTLVTMAAMRAFQRYGAIVDHPIMDHYGQYAPLIYGGIGTTYSIRNTYEYTKALKLTTEPRRSWVWAQGVAPGTWGTQPTAWGIDVQFWNHIAGGAKGLLWFKAVPSELAGFPAQEAKIVSLIEQLNHVRNLVVYADVLENVTPSSSNALGASVIGKDHMLVVVTNASGTYTNNLFGGSVSFSNVTTDVAVDLPSWIVPGTVREVTSSGFVNTSLSNSVSGGTLNISNIVLNESNPTRVFLLGPADTTAPEVPQGIRVADWINPTTAVVAWKEATDNLGVVGYEVRDSQNNLLAQVKHPIAEVSIPADGELVIVRAIDGSGNVSGPSDSYFVRRFRWAFDVDGYTHGWRFGNNDFLHTVENGAIEVLHPGSNGRIQIDELHFAASASDVIRVRVRNQTDRTVARIQWRQTGESGFAGARSLNTTVTAHSADFEDITFNVGGVATWNGNIEELRLLPANNATSGTSYVSSIEINPVPPPSSVDDWMILMD